MTSSGILLILVFIAVIAALTAPLGAYMDKVFAGERTWAHKLLRPLEVAIYKLCGINEATEQHWTCYAGGVLAIGGCGNYFRRAGWQVAAHFVG